MQAHQGYALRIKLGFLEICLLQYWLIFNVFNHPPSFLVKYIISYLCCFSPQVLSFKNSPFFNLKKGRNVALLELEIHDSLLLGFLVSWEPKG